MTSFVFDAAACRAQNQSFSAQRAEIARRWRAGARARVNLNLDLLNTVDNIMLAVYCFLFFYQWDTDT